MSGEGGTAVAIKARLGAGVWDMLVCEDCSNIWSAPDVDYEWTDDPESELSDCPRCHSNKVVREERG